MIISREKLKLFSYDDTPSHWGLKCRLALQQITWAELLNPLKFSFWDAVVQMSAAIYVICLCSLFKSSLILETSFVQSVNYSFFIV